MEQRRELGRQQNSEHGTFRNIPEHPGTGQIITKKNEKKVVQKMLIVDKR